MKTLNKNLKKRQTQENQHLKKAISKEKKQQNKKD